MPLLINKQSRPVLDQSRRLDGKFTDLLSLFSQNVIVCAGKSLGLLAYIIDKRHRRIVIRNIRFTYPELSRAVSIKFARRIFQNTGITILEICRIAFASHEDILKRVRIKGEENLLAAADSPTGAIFISAHLGNWEMCSLFGAIFLGKGSVLVGRKFKSGLIEKLFRRLRTTCGNQLIDKKGALTTMARTLRKGGLLAMLIDQETRKTEGVEVNFFGRKAFATPAAAMLAQRYNSLVVPIFCIREKDLNLTLVVQPPLHLEKTDDIKTSLQVNTQIMTDVIEKAVREYPEQWFWFHKRWKRHYPDLYAEDLAKRKRRREKKYAKLKKNLSKSNRY